MIPRLSAGTSLRYSPIESSTDSAPRASSARIAAAVNCFVIEPSEKTLAVVIGVPVSRSARP